MNDALNNQPMPADLAALSKQLAARLEPQASELYQLANIVAVAAVASEAVRALSAIDDACRASPEVDAFLSRHCEARAQWSSTDPTNGLALGAVLAHVSARLEAVATRVAEAPCRVAAQQRGA